MKTYQLHKTNISKSLIINKHFRFKFVLFVGNRTTKIIKTINDVVIISTIILLFNLFLTIKTILKRIMPYYVYFQYP